jgi:hypothetical protein
MQGESFTLSLSLEAKVRRAQVAYQRAVEEYRRLSAIARDTISPDDPGFADGQFALRRAIQIERRARREYEQALREFTEFVLNGQGAPERAAVTSRRLRQGG